MASIGPCEGVNVKNNTMRKSVFISLFFALVLVFGTASFALADEEGSSKISGESGQLGKALTLSRDDGAKAVDAQTDIHVASSVAAVSRPSQDDIRKYLLNNKIAANQQISYPDGQMPSIIAPGNAGAIDQASLTNGLNMLNWIRYIAGIQSNVSLDPTYNEQCQAGALVMSWNKAISHSPAKPEGIDEDIYALGYEGASHSNISSGFAGPAATVLAYMSDSDSGNIGMVGHRRWCLNPSMGKTGFGHVYQYGSMYSVDTSNTSAPDYEAVVWPANNTPSALFSKRDPWSISASWIDPSDTSISVDLVRDNDGRAWHFTKDEASSDGYFAISSSIGDGSSCLIFRPVTDGEQGVDRLNDQDRYSITVKTKDRTYSYSVTFFALFPSDSVEITDFNDNVISGTLSLSLNGGRKDVSAPTASSKAPAEGTAQYFDGINYYKALDSGENLPVWISSNSQVVKVIDGEEAGFFSPSSISATLIPVSVGKCNITVKRGSLEKTIEVEITDPSSDSSEGDSDGTNQGNGGSGNVNPGDSDSGNADQPGNASGATNAQSPSQALVVSGTWKKSHGKWWYSYNASTANTQKKPYPANEWVSIGGKKYHFDKAGYMHSGWQKLNGKWYYFGSDGAMKTGWQKVKDRWYYLNPIDGIMQTGKQGVGNKTYFFKSDGAMKTGWKQEDGAWFYYNSGGVMAKGWVKVKSKWYFLASNGKMQTKWAEDKGKRYYLDPSSGAMKIGWQKIDNNWFYFDKSGVMQTSKWISGKYWVEANGVMATNTWVDGDKYYVDESGRWVPGKKRSS